MSEGNIKKEAILTGAFATLRLVKQTIIEVFKDNNVTSSADYIDDAITELMRIGKKHPDTESKCNKQNVINWAYFPEEKPDYGDEILLQYPPEQMMDKVIVVYDRNVELIDGCKWALITPCL